MMSEIPLKISDQNKDKQILRAGIIAELDATSLYEQMADNTSRKDIKAVLMDIAKEEKTHTGEFLYLLKEYDKQTAEELIKGSEEDKKLLKVI